MPSATLTCSASPASGHTSPKASWRICRPSPPQRGSLSAKKARGWRQAAQNRRFRYSCPPISEPMPPRGLASMIRPSSMQPRTGRFVVQHRPDYSVRNSRIPLKNSARRAALATIERKALSVYICSLGSFIVILLPIIEIGRGRPELFNSIQHQSKQGPVRRCDELTGMDGTRNLRGATVRSAFGAGGPQIEVQQGRQWGNSRSRGARDGPAGCGHLHRCSRCRCGTPRVLISAEPDRRAKRALYPLWLLLAGDGDARPFVEWAPRTMNSESPNSCVR